MITKTTSAINSRSSTICILVSAPPHSSSVGSAPADTCPGDAGTGCGCPATGCAVGGGCVTGGCDGDGIGLSGGAATEGGSTPAGDWSPWRTRSARKRALVSERGGKARRTDVGRVRAKAGGAGDGGVKV